MAYARKHRLTVSTIADGTATAFSEAVSGKLVAIIYTKIDFAVGVDFTITSKDTKQGLWTESNVDASKTVAPRQVTHSVLGVAGSGEDDIVLVNEPVQIVIAAGGNVKSGTFEIIFE